MSKNLDRLKRILSEMFQMDQTDLDFGIYRIMNQKREEINLFLDKDLLPQVKKAFQKYSEVDRAAIQNEIEQTGAELDKLGVVKENSAKYLKLLEKLNGAVDVTGLEEEVYSHLTEFFRRYYNNGDFLSLQRYKDNVYAIPYQGEEVKLHWANTDQYYIKTTEYFSNYAVTLSDGKKVHFKLVDANTEENNNKPAQDKERRFILSEENQAVEEEGNLYIRFEYRTDKSTQAALNEEAVSFLKLYIPEKFKEKYTQLFSLAPTEKNPKRTLLEKHLNDYTARNTFDYFIHKDLGGFLIRELDFYIKNEIMHLDDLNTEREYRIEQYIAKIKVVKEIGHKIIALLEQIENFQKKLWLKKKFVVESNYCFTLDRVPEKFYSEITANQKQIDEWIKLFAIDEIQISGDKSGFSEPLTVEFLQDNPYLILDTGFFEGDFKDRLLAKFDYLDNNTDGLLIHSENLQALNLLQEKYREQIKCIYIDPPFNTSASEILYKNYYKNSTWLSLLENRLSQSKLLLTNDGLIQVAIDDEEYRYLNCLCEQIFGINNYIASIAIMHNPRGRSDAKHIATSHEYSILYAKDIERLKTNQLIQSKEELLKKYGKVDDDSSYRELPFRRSGSNSMRSDRPNLYYPVYYNSIKKEISTIKLNANDVEILPIDSYGQERVWRWGKEKVNQMPKSHFIVKNNNGKYSISVKDRIKVTIKPKSLWFGPEFDASSHGTMLIKAMFKESLFDYPKSINTVKNALEIGSDADSMVLDFFAGSGTTGHAVIELNRNVEDNSNRKYILVEMAEYFYTVLKPRIQKAIYSKDWKDGKPVSRDGSSHIFKYIRLESYEDALNNLELKPTPIQKLNFDLPGKVPEQYMLSYMLDVETRDSTSLLNIDAFTNPFAYKMKISRDGEAKIVNIDLVETFNYLLGLKVEHLDKTENFTAVLNKKAEKPGTLRLRPCKGQPGIFTFRQVTGTTRTGEKVLIIWRVLTGVMASDNAALDAYFTMKEYNPRDMEFSRIYVNGDNNLVNLKADEAGNWKVMLIEEEFKRLMFDVRDI